MVAKNKSIFYRNINFHKDTNGVIKILKRGGIGILPTDTIYGLVGSALSKKAVAEIYKLRCRNAKKPLIILISAIKDLSLFGIKLAQKTIKLLKNLWPGKISVVLPCPHKKFFELHRGTKTLAFRLPAKKNLIKLLKSTGPLVAPSANFEGKPPAQTIKQAQKYFGTKVDFYIDGGKLAGKPSTLVAIENGKVVIKRKGVAKI